MLLRPKKVQSEEKNWSIILNPIRSEIDRRRICQKISEAFSLAVEESSDLVANTPIILLDNLSRDDAMRVKTYFQTAGAEIMLTSDTFLKRKCYRTVWPEQPTLHFLSDSNLPKAPEAEPEEKPQPLGVDEALQEMHSMTDEGASPSSAQPAGSESSVTASAEREKLAGEIEHWRRESLEQEEEIGRLRREVARLQGEVQSARPSPSEEIAREAKDKEIQELQALLANAEEKYEGLKEEYRETRILLEEKISRLVKEMDQWKLRAEESASKFSQLEKARAVSEQLAGEQVQQVSLWRDKFQTLQRKYEALERAGAEEKAQRMRHEDRLKEIEQAQTQWMQDLEAVRREARQWEDRAFTLEKNAEEIRRTYEEQNRGLQDKLRNLESREKELETARRQLREANLQMEQREAAQKRVQLVAQLAEKETSLKRLVQDQQRMESEIREREEAMRRVLAEQEMIEKEIIEGKQAERYLLEKVKKESGPRHKSAKSETGYLRVPPDEEGPVSERA